MSVERLGPWVVSDDAAFLASKVIAATAVGTGATRVFFLSQAEIIVTEPFGEVFDAVIAGSAVRLNIKVGKPTEQP